MIKITDKIWYVLKPDHSDDLAYMCPYSESKDGEPLSNVSKMQATGRSWAGTGSQNVWKTDDKGNYIRDENQRLILDHVIPPKAGAEFISDNTPTTGFYVGSSVSRWSTSNKLFRVKDPRGFTVEIPTDNLATLLHHTTVVKGFVEEECVWGREGSNHILLPVNSEPYLETLDKMYTVANKLISVKDLKVGDWVKMFESKSEYYYLGKLKATWKLRGYSYETSWRIGEYGKRYNERYSDWVEIEDDKWVDVFLRPYNFNTPDGTKYSVEIPSKPKVVEVIKKDKLDVTTEEICWYCPARISNKTNITDTWMLREAKLASYKVKT